MRFYAIVGSMQVLPTERSDSLFKHVASHFSHANKTSLSPEEAKEFFYANTEKVELFESYADAVSVSVKKSARHGHGMNVEFYPNKHKFYATPIFTVELSDSIKFDCRWTRTITLNSEDEQALANELKISTNEREVKNWECEKKDVLAIVAVEVAHPNFKKHHIEIDKLENEHAHTK